MTVKTRPTPSSPETKALYGRGLIVTSAANLSFAVTLGAIHRTVPVWFAVAVAGASYAAAAAILVHFRTVAERAQAAVTGEFDEARERRARRTLRWAFGVPMLVQVVVLAVLVAVHA